MANATQRAIAEPRSRGAVLAGNIILLERAERIREAFESAGIPLLFIKGAAFLGSLYTDLSERSMCDLDMLILRRDKDRARGLMDRLGYLQRGRPLGREATWDEHYNQCFESSDPLGIVVELHTELCQVGRYAVDYPAMIARCRALDDGARRIVTLDPVDSVISLILHGSKHFFLPSSLRLEDCARIFTMWRPDHQTLWRRIEDYRIQLPAALYLAKLAADIGPGPGKGTLPERRRDPRQRGRLIDFLTAQTQSSLALERGKQALVMLLSDGDKRQLASFAATYAKRRIKDSIGATIGRLALLREGV